MLGTPDVVNESFQSAFLKIDGFSKSPSTMIHGEPYSVNNDKDLNQVSFQMNAV
jgi:hypothetical protein